MSDLPARLRDLIAREASPAELMGALKRFRDEGGTRAAAERALEELRAEGLRKAGDDRVVEMLDVARGSCCSERRLWPAPELQWWVTECSHPELGWCRARVLVDGSWELVDGDRKLHRFLDAEAARAWLRDEEYAPFDATAREERLAAGARAEDLRTPRAGEHEPDFEVMAVCGSCGARWHDGEHTAGCDECGGGALVRGCPLCGGACGVTWRRSALDSNDSREAHWAGGCGRA